MWSKFANLFAKKNSLRGASLMLVVTMALSNLIGLFRDRFLTKNIDTYDLDIYTAAFRVPDLVFNVMILGAVYSAFVPIFSDYVAQKKDKDGFRIANSLLTLSLIFIIIIGGLLVIFMPYVMKLVSPGFDQGRFDQTVLYARILMATPIFFSFSYILSGILNSYRRFFAYAVAPLVYNLSITAGAFFLAPHYGVLGVIYSVVFGAFLHFFIQFFPAMRLGWRYLPIVKIKDEAVGKILRLVIPRTIGLGANQISLITYTSIGSTLVAGSIAAYTFADHIQTVPSVVLGSAFATALFPSLAQKISKNDLAGFSKYFDRALRVSMFLLIPVSAIFIIFRAQIVRLVLGSGKFGWEDTKVTALVLGFFSISILAQGLTPLFLRAFYALKNTRTPMFISIFTVALSITLAFVLSKKLGAPGLSLAFSIASYFSLFMLIYFLERTVPKIINFSVIISFVKVFVISIISSVSMWISMHYFANLVNMNTYLGVLAQTLLSILVGAVVFFLLALLVKSPEIGWILKRDVSEE